MKSALLYMVDACLILASCRFMAGKNGGKSASGLVPVTAKHGADIKIGNLIHWNIDHRQMGEGGDTSWGRFVHDKYTIQISINHHLIQEEAS